LYTAALIAKCCVIRTDQSVLKVSFWKFILFWYVFGEGFFHNVFAFKLLLLILTFSTFIKSFINAASLHGLSVCVGYIAYGLFSFGLTNQKENLSNCQPIRTSRTIYLPPRTKPNRPKLKRPDVKLPFVLAFFFILQLRVCVSVLSYFAVTCLC